MNDDLNDGAQPESDEPHGGDPSAEVSVADAEDDVSPEGPRAPSLLMEDDRFATTIRFRGELQKPSMTGEGDEDDLTIKVKVAGFDLSDLHHTLRPYAGRVVEAVILPIRVAEEREGLPWESGPHPDQTELPLDEDAEESGQFVCVACGATCEIGVDGHCPDCGGTLRPRDETDATEAATDEGGGCGGTGIAVIGHDGDQDIEGACPGCSHPDCPNRDRSAEAEHGQEESAE